MSRSSSKPKFETKNHASSVAVFSPERGYEQFHRPYFEQAMKDRQHSPERQLEYQHAFNRHDVMYPRSQATRERLDPDIVYRRLSPDREMLYHKLSPERSPGKYGFNRYEKENNDPYLQFIHKSADVYCYDYPPHE